MKALSVRPDYAMQIFEGTKTIEYRTWKTNLRDDLLICSTAKKMPGCLSGHALIVMEVLDCVQNDSGIYEWKLGNPYYIQPFPIKGKQGLFNVDDDLIKPFSLEEKEDLTEQDYLNWLEENIYSKCS